MRKYILGVMIAIVFVVYSVLLRHQHSEPVVAPSSLSQNSTTTVNPTQTAAPTPTKTNTTPAAEYKDGSYTGDVENAFYGNVQVAVTIASGKITVVNFLQSPDDNPNSLYVNQTAMPYLKQEAIKAQSAKVSVVTGATFTSQAFMQSLSSALSQAM
jgi:uncharacterized protein with FMN-binding domain